MGRLYGSQFKGKIVPISVVFKAIKIQNKKGEAKGKNGKICERWIGRYIYRHGDRRGEKRKEIGERQRGEKKEERGDRRVEKRDRRDKTEEEEIKEGKGGQERLRSRGKNMNRETEQANEKENERRSDKERTNEFILHQKGSQKIAHKQNNLFTV